MDVDLNKVEDVPHLTESLRQEMCRALRVRPQQVLCQRALSGQFGAFQFGFGLREVVVKKQHLQVAATAKQKLATGVSKIRALAKMGMLKQAAQDKKEAQTAPAIAIPGTEQCNELKYDSVSNPIELYCRFVDLISGKSGRQKVFQSDAFPILAHAHAETIRWTSVTVAPLERGIEMLTEGRGRLLEHDIDEELKQIMERDFDIPEDKAGQSDDVKKGRRATLLPSSQQSQPDKLRSVLQDLLFGRTEPELYKKYSIEPNLAPAIFRQPMDPQKYWSVYGARERQKQKQRQAEVMSKLKELGFTPLSKESRKSWPLHQMAWDDDQSALQNALASTTMAKKASDLDHRGHTVAHVAAIRAGPPIMDAIVTCALEIGLDLEKVDDMGRTALHYAALRGHPEVAELLAMALPTKSLNMPDKHTKDTPLILAARGSHSEIILSLLQLKASTDPANSRGLTALHECSASGCSACCEALLSSRANPSALDNLCRSPLHWAALRQHEDVVQLLLEAGADPTLATTNGDKALSFAKRASPTLALCALEDVDTPEVTFSMIGNEDAEPAVDRMWTSLPVTASHITEFESQGVKLEVSKKPVEKPVTPRPKSSGGLSTARRGRLWQTWKGAGMTAIDSQNAEDPEVAPLRGRSFLDEEGAVKHGLSTEYDREQRSKASLTTQMLSKLTKPKGNKVAGSLGVRWRLWALDDLEDDQPPVSPGKKRDNANAPENVAVACAELGGFFCPCCRQYVLEDHPTH